MKQPLRQQPQRPRLCCAEPCHPGMNKRDDSIGNSTNLLLVTLWLIAIAQPVLACDYLTMRDAGFDEPRDVHRLCVIGASDDDNARQIHTRLNQWLTTEVADLNLELRFLATDDETVVWKDYGIPSAPPETPVVVLAGYRSFQRQGFYIDHWQPAPSDDDLKTLATSPARNAIARQVGQHLAVLVHVAGNGTSAQSATPLLEQTVRQWATKKEWLDMTVVNVDRTDPRERLLLSFIGIEPTGPDWVSVIFGRGKFMPAMEGDAITEANLNDRLETLIEECTCNRPPRSLGTDILLRWDTALDDATVRLKSKDAPNAPTATAPASQPTAVLDNETSNMNDRLMARMLWTVAGLVAVVGIATVMLTWRRRPQ